MEHNSLFGQGDHDGKPCLRDSRDINLETHARELGVLSTYEKDGERMKWMHDLIDYSDYTAEIVRGALLDAHDALCELIGGAPEATKALAEIGGVAAWLRKLATEQPAWTPNGPYKEPPER